MANTGSSHLSPVHTSNMSKQHVECFFDMSKEIEHVQFVSTSRKDEKIVRHVAKHGNMSNGNIRHVEETFDMLLRHVAGVDGA